MTARSLDVRVSMPELLVAVPVMFAALVIPVSLNGIGVREAVFVYFLKDADKVNKAVKLFSISVGKQDFALAGSKALAGVLNKHGIKNELRLSGGGHTWINWRHYLNEFAPKLFQ